MKKHLFATSDGTYLLSHSIGKMPCSATQIAQKEFFTHWQSGDDDIWNHWLSAIDDFKQSIAELFNAPATTFCPQNNISSGLTKVIQALPPKPGKNVIVMCESDFPSAGFVLQQAQSQGYTLRIIPKTADIQDIATWKQALTEDTHSVFITHVHYNTSKRSPVRDICQIARERNVNSIVDIAQSAGIVPIDFAHWNSDIVVGSCIKWLCGGPGAGYLWINPELVKQLKPLDVGWFSHINPFEFDINNFEYADDSSRFWGGTPSVLPFVIASNSIKLINSIGVSNIQKHNQQLIDRLTNSLVASSIISPRSDKPRGGTLVINPNNRQQLEQRLQQAQVKFDSRALGIRLSPHIYNTETEIDEVIECFND